jgi:hypothetical protein
MMHDLNWLILVMLLGFAGLLYTWLLGDRREDPRP